MGSVAVSEGPTAYLLALFFDGTLATLLIVRSGYPVLRYPTRTLPNLPTFNYFPSLHLQKGQLFPPFIWFHAHVFYCPRLMFLA